ncbi:hypothetical protein CDAR_115201 [Caerostris darwini]|uniref:Uncharacterized protein n=1 Tax=Caerostris darwini TaxID=1538125 RepID=A0AAV4U9Y1_9ARAC|nr:hypothetical protein CDAR_115201 [Caerostris darwini]
MYRKRNIAAILEKENKKGLRKLRLFSSPLTSPLIQHFTEREPAREAGGQKIARMPFNLSSLNAIRKSLERMERLYFPEIDVLRRIEGVEECIYKKQMGRGGPDL